MSEAGPQDESFSALLDDQRRHWLKGERYLVESYLELYPRLLADSAALLKLVCAEIALRREIGENPQPDEYLRRFPQLESELRLHFGLPAINADPPGVSAWPSTASAPVIAEPPPMDALEALPSIPGYEIHHFIDSGGQGSVYKARHVSLDRIVALKVLRSDRSADAVRLARFRREGRVIARLEHPHIVRVHDFGESGGRLFLSMEFLAGGTMHDRLGKSGPLEPQAAVDLLLALTKAVEHAHQKGIVHRDLKPGNVLFTLDGKPKVADFGLAKVLDDAASHHTHTGVLIGSPSYMAPEQAAGKVSQIGTTTDIYALGAILYELLTGKPPFRGESILDTLDKVRFEKVEPPSRVRAEIPFALEEICLKCLEKDPARRYSSAAQLAHKLETALREKQNPPSQAPRKQESTVTDPPRPRAEDTVDEIVPGENNPPHLASLPEGFRLIARIGEGGFGEVWKAVAPGDIPVAIKVSHRPVSESIEADQLRALASIKSGRHPYLLPIHAYWVHEQRLHVVMQLADCSLRDRLAACVGGGLPSGIPVGELLGYMKQAALAIDYLHGKQLLHRMVKPDSLLLVEGFVKLGSFSLLCNQKALTEENAVAGVPAYMAPECFRGEVGKRSDQYALAVSYMELRTNRRPFPARSGFYEAMLDAVEGTPSLQPLKGEEERVVLKALAKSPVDRFSSCAGFVEALEMAVDGV